MPDALIVAHGSPSDPAPHEAAMVALAAKVSQHLPGWRVRGATLAAQGSLGNALEGLDAPRLLPFFMAEGWFTRVELARRLKALGATNLARLPAFGHLPDMPRLCARAALDGIEEAGLDPRKTSLVLAAHGSQISRASAEGARAMAAVLGRLGPFARVLTGFVEEEPFLFQAARGLGPAICLPFFALRASHVAEDVPDALEAAGFRGPLLPAIGEHPGVPAILAAALAQHSGPLQSQSD